MLKTCVSVLIILLVSSSTMINGSKTVAEVTSKTILVTGFEPFSSYDVNPSALVAESLNNTIVEDTYIIGIILPVDFEEAVEETLEKVIEVKPCMVLSMGLSPSAEKIEVEYFAFNLQWDPYSTHPLFSIKPVIPHSPPIHRVTIDVPLTISKLREMGIPSKISFSPGFYVCNSLLYSLLDHLDNTSIGFLHLPSLDKLSLDTLVEAAYTTIEVNLN